MLVLQEGRASQVRYAGFVQDRAALRAYLDALSAVGEPEFAAWNKAQRMAFLINAYNAWTVEKILTRYPDLKSIRDFGTVFGNPWKDRFSRLFGRVKAQIVGEARTATTFDRDTHAGIFAMAFLFTQHFQLRQSL